MTTKLLILSLLITTTFFCSCFSQQSDPENVQQQTRKIFKTGCYPIDLDSIGPGLHNQSDGMYTYLDTLPVIDINDFKEVSVSKSTGKYLVNIVLTDAGSKKFTDATEKYIGQSLGFVIDNKLVMTPHINEKITGNSIMIDGGFTEEEMINCYRQIKAAMETK
jgi:preprotein translocase subunit SecD